MKYGMELAVVALIIVLRRLPRPGRRDPGNRGGSLGRCRRRCRRTHRGFRLRAWIEPSGNPSGEIESLLFALQAAIGAVVIGISSLLRAAEKPPDFFVVR